MTTHEFASADLTAGQLNALVKKVGGKDVVLQILRGTAEVVVNIVKLLTKLTTVQLKGIPQFTMNEETQKAANIGYMWDDFKSHFFGKTEENIGDLTVAVHKLEKDSLDKPILEELEEKAEISLAQFVELLKQQSQGQEGTLLVNGWANIAYIRDKKGNLWAVDAGWDSADRYWHVNAYSVEIPRDWSAGGQVLSCDC